MTKPEIMSTYGQSIYSIWLDVAKIVYASKNVTPEQAFQLATDFAKKLLDIEKAP